MKARILIPPALVLSAFAALAAPTNDVAGHWQGTLDTGTAKLRLVFKISKAASGALTAKLDSLDQGARDIPVDTVTASNKTLRMEVKVVQGLYVGTLDATGTRISGLWSQGAAVFRLDLQRGRETNAVAAVEKLSAEDLAANQLAAQKLPGIWNGTLDAGVAGLRLRINLTKTAAGGATGTMDSLDQGAVGIPLSGITLKHDKLHFEAKGIGGVYEGKLDPAGSGLTGEWRQGGQTFPLDFKLTPAK